MSAPMGAAVAAVRRSPLIDFNGQVQRRLAHFNRKRLLPQGDDARWGESLQQVLQMGLMEGHFIEAQRRALRPLLEAVPAPAGEFMGWFEALRDTGPGQHDPLFDWLAQDASAADMHWFLEQEVAGETGFDDLIALTQVGMPARPKLEMARNYWDELGRGKERRMHGPMLQRTAAELKLAPKIESVVWEALALANLMLGLACNRRYAYQSVGALGAVELTAPSRVSRVDAGLQRLGVSREARSYFTLHASIDIKHSQDWNAEVIRPLIEGQPPGQTGVQRAIAEGALLRLSAGARCFERYRRSLMPDDEAYPEPDREPGREPDRATGRATGQMPDQAAYPSAARCASSPSASRAPISFR